MSTVDEPLITNPLPNASSLTRLPTGLRVSLQRAVRSEAVSFLLVGAAGYAVDVGAFNLFWGTEPFDKWDPSIAKIAAVALAMIVTYLGNAIFTWPGRGLPSLRQILLFVAFNTIGLGFSLVTLWISHDLLGLRTRLDDNISANVIGLALGKALRYVTYRQVVFREQTDG
jgi:putative flippase GtrA